MAGTPGDNVPAIAQEATVIRPRALILLALVLVLSACGSGDNGVSSASPNDALKQSADALNSVKTYHLHFVAGKKAGAPTIDLDVAVPGKARGRATFGKASTDLIYADHNLYIRGGTFVAQALGPVAAQRLGNRWLRSPQPDDSLGFLTDASALGRCLRRTDRGKLVNGGKTMVDGQPATVVSDRGDRPGDAPERITLAAQEKPFPLLIEQLGPRSQPPAESAAPSPKAATSPLCFPGSDSTLKFSRFGQPVSVKAPADSVEVSSLR